jgi:uncharacterized protein YciI
MRQQHEQGRVFMSGPVPSESLGMYVLRAPSREEAQKVARSEPFAKGGLTEPEIRDWDVHQVLGVGPFSLADMAAGS